MCTSMSRTLTSMLRSDRAAKSHSQHATAASMVLSVKWRMGVQHRLCNNCRFIPEDGENNHTNQKNDKQSTRGLVPLYKHTVQINEAGVTHKCCQCRFKTSICCLLFHLHMGREVSSRRMSCKPPPISMVNILLMKYLVWITCYNYIPRTMLKYNKVPVKWHPIRMAGEWLTLSCD